MASKDLHNHINVKPAFLPSTATTDNTALVSTIVDTLGYESLEFVALFGSIADADATFVLALEHGDVSNLSDAAAVPAAQTLGTTALATPLFSDDGKAFKVGYIGPKRYVRATYTPAANTGAINMSAVWLQGDARLEPTPNPPV